MRGFLCILAVLAVVSHLDFARGKEAENRIVTEPCGPYIKNWWGCGPLRTTYNKAKKLSMRVAYSSLEACQAANASEITHAIVGTVGLAENRECSPQGIKTERLTEPRTFLSNEALRKVQPSFNRIRMYILQNEGECDRWNIIGIASIWDFNETQLHMSCEDLVVEFFKERLSYAISCDVNDYCVNETIKDSLQYGECYSKFVINIPNITEVHHKYVYFCNQIGELGLEPGDQTRNNPNTTVGAPEPPVNGANVSVGVPVGISVFFAALVCIVLFVRFRAKHKRGTETGSNRDLKIKIVDYKHLDNTT